MLKNSDTTMKQLWLALSEDAKASSNNSVFVNPMRRYDLATDNIQSFRSRVYTHDFMTEDPYKFKWEVQLDALFKRYKFSNDSFEEKVLDTQASAKFKADQVRISGPLSLSWKTKLVLHEARKIVREVLGRFNEEEHESLCKLSSHANRGVPYNQAFFDIKVKRLTGSVEHMEWFRNYLKKDGILNHAVHEKGAPRYVPYDCLRLAKVPKSWKAVRTMMPHTVCGSFYTYGIGLMIRQRLLDAGQDISNLQERHKMLARKFSISRTHATADLSSASDSFNRELLCRLLPRAWYTKIMFGNPRYYEDDGIKYSLQSSMTMGMGHTFPLQTLLFSSLLKAVQMLSGINGLISVYGDDLIYPRRMHKFVVPIFSELNFCINLEKTFVSTHFRESCGGDYYRGIDVRPFSPEGRTQHLSRIPYLEFLYKLWNGLRLRWEECEIPRTLHFLLTEIVNASNVVHQVPPSYPATAGLHMPKPRKPGLIPWSPVAVDAHGLFTFHYLKRVGKDRTIFSEGIHYWHCLRNKEHAHHSSDLYGSSRPLLRCKKLRRGKKVLFITIEDDKSGFRPLSQTGRDLWS
nr:MAG: RNA dependent RNA polymerase [Leviviridae sp.]